MLIKPKFNIFIIAFLVVQSPVACSPQKNLTGPPRVARDLAADLYNNIQKWNDFHIKGAHVVKQIAILKSEEPSKFSSQLEEFTTDLYRLVEGISICNNNFEALKSQFTALAKLQKEQQPIFISYDGEGLASLCHYICNAYLEEFKVLSI